MTINWRNLFKSSAKPRIAPGHRVFAVGDIHGRCDLLDALLAELVSYAEKTPSFTGNTVVFLGDYVDRGPDSRAVISRLIRLKQHLLGWKLVFLRGNHDQSVLDFVKDPGIYRSWRNFGGAQTLLSYGVAPPLFEDGVDFARARDEFVRKCPPAHLQFLDELRYFHVEDDYVFVHAGLRPGVQLADQTPEDLLWIRDEFLLHRRKFEKIVVHGHTPSPSPINLPNRIGIDTGAHATGRLTAVVLDGESRSFLDAARNHKPVDALSRLIAVNG